MGVMIASLLLMLFVQGMLPFGAGASWSDQGLGTAFVLTQPDSTVAVGQRVVGQAEVQGKVHIYSVEDVTRQNGALQYHVSNGGAEVELMPAQELGRSVVMTLPFMGVWVRVLQSGLGVLTLIGLPLFMFLINVSMRFGQRLLPVLRVFEQKVAARRIARKEMREQKRIENESIEEAYAYEELPEVEEVTSTEREFVTVLKPYSMRRGYGM